MAMLVLSDVFASTWEGTAEPWEGGEFWPAARAAVPGFVMLAEVYWDLEARLQELGFDFTYDKRFYDRLVAGPPADVDGHLHADAGYQLRSARFIENHDEPRSAFTFGARVTAAAVGMSTVPGLRFFFDGQFEGRRIRLPVQLGRDAVEPIDVKLQAFYDRLLATVDAPIFHDGEWGPCGVRAIDHTSANVLAWRFSLGLERRFIVVNLGVEVSQAHVDLGPDLPGAGETIVLDDLMDASRYERSRAEIVERGLYVRLQVGQAHVLAVEPEAPARPGPDPPSR